MNLKKPLPVFVMTSSWLNFMSMALALTHVPLFKII